MTRKKRVYGILLTLALALALGLMPGMSLKAYAEGVTYLDYDGGFTEKTCEVYTEITEDAASTLESFEDGTWYVVRESVTVSTRITVSGTAHLILMNGATLTATKGIAVNSGNGLTIYGQSEGSGSLVVKAVATNNAGIGGDNGKAAGTITINGGSVDTTGGISGAGIGGGKGSSSNMLSGGTIIINGGSVNATGGGNSGGIGGGHYGSSGDITINGGTVVASSDNGAGIGAGAYGSIDNITINGGDVEAVAVQGAAIGSGRNAIGGGTITINGGDITARGANPTTYPGAGIGDGRGAGGSTIIINGGNITAIGGSHRNGESTTAGGGIGYGASHNTNKDGDITINGGKVTAVGGSKTPGINSSTVVIGEGVTIAAGPDEENLKDVTASFATDHSQRYVTVERSHTEPRITGCDLVLNGTLDFRFYVELPDNFDAAGAYMSFTVPGRNGRSYVRSFSEGADIGGKKVYSCPVYALEMAKEITAVFHYGENSTTDASYSVRQYLETFPDDGSKTGDLAAATRNYGHYIQPYLAGVHSFTLGEDSYPVMPAVSAITALTALSDFARTRNACDEAVISSLSYYNSFNESTTITIQVTLKTDPASVTASVDGAPLAVRSLGGNTYQIQIADIAANNLGVVRRVVFSADGNPFYDMNISALSYVSDVLASGREQAGEAEALTAFYQYYLAAKAYSEP